MTGRGLTPRTFDKPYDWDVPSETFVCQLHGVPECHQDPECARNQPVSDPLTGAQWNGVEKR